MASDLDRPTLHDSSAAIVAALADVAPYIRRIEAAANNSTRAAVDRYIGALLDAQIVLRRELAGVGHG